MLPEELWSDDAIAADLYDPSIFVTSRDGALFQAQRTIDARMDEIYSSLPGARIGFLIAFVGALSGTVILLIVGSLWAIPSGILTVTIMVLLSWSISSSRPLRLRRPSQERESDGERPGRS